MNCELPPIKDLTFEEYMKYGDLFNMDINSIGKQYKTKPHCVKEGCYKPSRFNRLCFLHGGDNRKICKKNKCYEFAVIKGVCTKHNPKKISQFNKKYSIMYKCEYINSCETKTRSLTKICAQHRRINYTSNIL
jgi:hypothetical protein